jgi:spore coat polysaccharide biosynthesis protein SpsF
MTSTRLPGKILMKVLGKPLLQYELERLKRVPSLDELVVATTKNAADDPVAALCERMGVASYRGSEFDVLSRYHEAAALHRAEAVVRFTADCPLMTPACPTASYGAFWTARENLIIVRWMSATPIQEAWTLKFFRPRL